MGAPRCPSRFPTPPAPPRLSPTLPFCLAELRERSESGEPVPVNINLEDRREHDSSEAKVKKPEFRVHAPPPSFQSPAPAAPRPASAPRSRWRLQAFSGGGYSLGKDWTQEAYSQAKAAAGTAGGQGGAGSGRVEAPRVDQAKLDALRCDESKPVCVIQVRAAGAAAC